MVAVVPPGPAANVGQILLWVVVPYAALAIFLAGFCYRVIKWAWYAGAFPHPYHLRTAEIPALDQARFAG